MDLKIKDVAELINISESKVKQLVTQGKVPGYKINGQYLFNRSEIEDWLMRQKQEVKNEREDPSDTIFPSKSGNMQFSLYRALYRGAVLSKVPCKTKEEVIQYTMKYMEKHFDLDAEVLTSLFLEREKLMPTSLGYGIAVPHTRDFLLSTHFDVIITVYPETPLDFGALDGQPTNVLFFLFASEDKNHLHLLAKIAHLSSSEKTRAFFRTEPPKERLLDYVKHWENSLNN